MIINFSIENWRSFRKKVTLSMVSGREKQHRERTMLINKPAMRLLPVAAIYGGNASGKTNLFQALRFARDFIVQGTRPENLINVEPFLLDASCANIPSHFSFELLIENKCYEYSFAVTQHKVIEEKLVEILATKEKRIYSRTQDNPISFDKELKEYDAQHLKFVEQATRSNQLFLTNAVNLNITGQFKAIYDWFKNTLVLIAPDARFSSYEKFIEDGQMNKQMSTTLAQLDTGITGIGGESIPIENLLLPENLKMDLMANLPEGKAFLLQAQRNGREDKRFVITRKDGKLCAEELVFYHQASNGAKVKFSMSQESDGTQRVIELLPAFLDAVAHQSPKVYIIDELDRCLHTLLTRKLLEEYLASCSEHTCSQLLFTAHDVLLLDQNLFRRDELWITERDNNGCSSLFSFSDYKEIRYDKDIRKSYLQGRLGGEPKLSSFSGFIKSEKDSCGGNV